MEDWREQQCHGPGYVGPLELWGWEAVSQELSEKGWRTQPASERARAEGSAGGHASHVLVSHWSVRSPLELGQEAGLALPQSCAAVSPR